ncbi:hypothetical protein P153DRAFT_369130 [Dothidotthia symphoricarpi CBS 119687]|uniref:Uncharacterized protein n=1 Tax=Dothidotthia symphoricarpi CBS 119687 TaxID=1392245 RepID=A0A6A6A3F4_9PLEO|nr:uncharacterized protein P153DRAFT_369130 [Dothidotthia symphoricarpi CBS 119687]KAF2126409.1 hypothetical protein P153DRAFT_369130 [Dothidotthia symphoricarpi CBS 119687]
METPTCSTPPPSSPRSPEKSPLFTKPPPGAPQRNTKSSVNPTTVILFTPPETPPKFLVSDPVIDNSAWDSNDPSTWPMVYLPYQNFAASSSSTPTHVDEMLVNVHYKGEGARKLRSLLWKAIDECDIEEDKQRTERLAFLYWPFNVTTDGWWKEMSGMTMQEMDVWRALTNEMKVQAEGADSQ